MSTLIIEGCSIAAMDGASHESTGTEIRDGHIVVTDGVITAVGTGPSGLSGRGGPAGRFPPVEAADGTSVTIDGRGCLATPGLINSHHHLYQWLTQGMAQQSVLFDWLTELYPLWARIDAEQVHAAASAGLAALALAGCSTSTDHHYIFPPSAGGRGAGRSGGPAGSGVPGGRGGGGAGGPDALAAEIDAARGLGIRFHPCRGSMDLGHSAGGLPPDEVVEETDAALAATEEAIRRFHDPSPGAMVRIAVAPCSPFSVTPRLMREAAALARRAGVRLHTHLAETAEEDAYCRQTMGKTPAEYADDLGWLGPDVWLAHGVHLDEPAVKRLAATGTSLAHCPSSNARLAAGIAPVRQLLNAQLSGRKSGVGLGVDGPASSEGSTVSGEMRQALLAARLRDGPAALSPRQALWLGTRGGARCLGREDEIGALRPGMLADVALWRLDTLAHDAYAFGGTDPDPVAALVMGPPAPLELLLVNGRPVVERDQLRTADITAITGEVRAARRRLLETR